MWYHRSILLIPALFLYVQAREILGPVSYEIENMRACDIKTNGKMVYDNVRVSRYNISTYILSGSVVLNTEFNDNMKVVISTNVWMNGAWRPTIFQRTLSKPCTLMTTFVPVFVEKIMTQILSEHQDFTCPIKPAIFNLIDFPVTVPDLPIPIPVPKGRYRVQLKILEDDEMIGCGEVIVMVDPKLN
ncbi:hypothetical protein O3M35_009631 [Rhynocoris fuscipes]|uniref:MD-2-related lipid-recognition domain-containing protein n=1 Tax=Rhynocoris fuscipes TaxID=488301 RepID=A0AAW1D541_9HEMI